MSNEELEIAIEEAVYAGDVEKVRQLLGEHPDLIPLDYGCGTWLHMAAYTGSIPMMQMLIELGCDVNAGEDGRREETPLFTALGRDDVDAVRLLLKHGADPNRGRFVITATTGTKQNCLKLIKLLEKHGADLHRQWTNEQTGEPMNALSSAIMWGHEDVAKYLRSRGVEMPTVGHQSGDSKSADDEVSTFFEKRFGQVQLQALIEIVPTEPPIVVHAIPATRKRKHATLFTTGMSQQPMTVPKGEEEYQYAEIFIQLPGNWKYMDIEDPNYGWPVHWLRSMAQHPHQHDTWLGGPVTIVANGEPPEPLAPNVKFTCVLLMAEDKLKSKDGRTIQLYRMTPLYTEERDLELREGTAALMNAFDQRDIPFIVNVNRPNVAIAD